MSSWLDTETKAFLEKSPPNKLASPDTVGFTLLLLSIWRHDQRRLVRAFERIRLDSAESMRLRLQDDLPLPIKNGLTHADALLGQFELISCDAISVFLTDEVVTGASQKYLDSLYQSLRQSDEFAETSVRIENLPNSDSGEEFIDQFLATKDYVLPATITTLRKKARIMLHWGNKIGGQVSIINP